MIRSMLFAAAFVASGCATMISGSYQNVKVTSTPAGAKACSKDNCITTPGELKLARGSDHEIVITLDGYVSHLTQLKRAPNPAGGGNMVPLAFIGPGVLIGAGIDAATGASNVLKPEAVEALLVKE